MNDGEARAAAGGCGAKPPPDAPPGGAGRVPVTLYDRWHSALNVDGVAFGKRVRALREQNTWTLRDVHLRTGVPIATISELEVGKSARPRVALYMTLAQCFGFESPGAMLGAPEAVRPPGTHPNGPRGAPGQAGAEDTTVQSLAAQLLRGLWQAQGEGRSGRVRRVTVLAAGIYDLDDPPEAPPGGESPAGEGPGGLTPPGPDAG